MEKKQRAFNWKTLAGLFLALVAYHFQTSRGPWPLWLIFLIGACVLLWVPWATVGKPRRIRNKEWDPVTYREFEKLMEKAEESLKISHGLSVKITIIVVLAILALIFWPIIASSIRDKNILWGLFDAAVIFAVVLLSGVVKVWTPPALDRKAVVLYDVLKELEKKKELSVSPQLLVGSTRKGKQIPVDAKIFAVPENAPAWLIGIQFQVNINRVKNNQYPYFYSVIILKPKTLRELFGIRTTLSTKKRFSHLKEICGVEDRHLTVEVQPQRDVDVIIIRQSTTRTSGYHTPERRVKMILEESLKILECIIKRKWQS